MFMIKRGVYYSKTERAYQIGSPLKLKKKYWIIGATEFRCFLFISELSQPYIFIPKWFYLFRYNCKYVDIKTQFIWTKGYLD